MGTRKLLLLVLLASGYTWAQEDGPDNQNPSCSKDSTKFKHLRKYVYTYEAGTSTGVTGTADSQSGSKFNCKVELEVPQPCNFILRIKQCTLREVYGVGSDGKVLMRKSKNVDDFSNVLSKNEVKFSVLDGKQVVLYPQADEPLNALNIKRGIISALFAPDETQQSYSMDTVYGKCAGEISVSSSQGSPATDFTVTRNLKTCDQFTPTRDYVSPIALLKGMNAPLSTLIKSSQSCQYTLDQKRRHITAVSCAENHIFLPFSYKDQYGITAKVSQSLKLDETPTRTNNREFSADTSTARGLAMEAASSNAKSEDVILDAIQQLQEPSMPEKNKQRAGLFYKLVTSLRGLNNDTLGPLVPRMNERSRAVTLQALVQCGSPECLGAILQILRSGCFPEVLVDTVTYSLGMLPSPCTKRVRELLNMAQYRPSRASFYALSHATSSFYENERTITPELQDVSNFMASLIDNECTGEEDKTFLSLKAIGIMGKALENANPQIKSSLLRCVRNQQTSPGVQKAAIQALRKMTTTDEMQVTLLQVFRDRQSSVQKKLAVYLMLMRNPSVTDLIRIVDELYNVDKEVQQFVATHIRSILNSEAQETKELRRKVEELLQVRSMPPTVREASSGHYDFSKHVPGRESLGIDAGINIIFDSDYVPKEVMLETTLNAFGLTVDMFEVSVDGKGFEPTLDALFGEGGFFPDTAMRALYWADGKVPEKVTEVLFKWFNIPRDRKQGQDFQKAVLLNLEKLANVIKSSNAPEAKAYLEILGTELGYIKLNDFKVLGELLLNSFRSARGLCDLIMRAIVKGIDTDLFLHYIFLDNEFDLPTGSGLQLKVSLAGVIAPGTRAGWKLLMKNLITEVSLNPAVAVEFVTQLGVEMPDFTRHAVQMNSNLYHESGFHARLTQEDGLSKLSFPAPKTPKKIFSFNNNLYLIYATRTEAMTSITENRQEVSNCKPLVKGLNYCLNSAYSNASTVEAAPYFPLTGQTRFDLEIQPTGEVEEYTLTANYERKGEEEDLIEVRTFSVQAEGAKTETEAKLIMSYSRYRIYFSSDVEIPKSNVNFGVSLKGNDESVDSRKSYSVVLDFHNQRVSEATLTGQLRVDGESDASLGAVLSIPRLDTELRSEVSLQKADQSLRLQLQSSANICSFSGSKHVTFTYDNEKIEVEWRTTSNSNLKKLVSKLPDISFSDLSNYPESVKDYANDILDYKVSQTDMTLRHIASHSVVAANNWLQKASKEMPFAETLQTKLSAWKQLEFDLPSFPEELFLSSDGKVRYLMNKDSFTIDIPLPYGGKRSDQLISTTSLRSLSMNLPSVGLKGQEFRIPAFTIPEYYPMKVPLIGVLEISSSIKSNYYNWSASYTGGNTSSDANTFSSKYEMKGDSVFDILTYKTDGNALLSYDHEKMLLLSFEGFLQHSLLETNIKFKELFNFRSNDLFSGTFSYLVRSNMGMYLNFDSSLKSTVNNKVVTIEGSAFGLHKVATSYLKSDYTTLTTFDPINVQAKTTSNFKLDSSRLKIKNEMTGMFFREAFSLTSTTDMQEGALTNTMTLDYRNKQLYLKSNTNGNYYNLVCLNKFEATFSSQKAAIRSEYQADYMRHRLYTLLSGSLDSLGLELNADVTLNNMANRAGHKATLQLNREGLSTSSTTSVNFNPFTLENQFNAGVGSSGMLMKVATNGRYREHNARISVEGKGSLTELSIVGLYEANVLAMSSKDNLNFKINKEGLRFSNNLLAAYDEMKVENSIEFTIQGTSLQFTSKFEDHFSSINFYKQNFEFGMQPYTIGAQLNQEFKYNSLELANGGQLQLEAFKINLKGDMRGALSKDEIKHSYVFSLNGLTSKLNTDTIANIQGLTHAHQVTVEIAGLSAAITSNSNCETKSMRLTNKIHSAVAPFSFKLDSQTNGDGRLQAIGDHSGQLYSKLLLNAEILSFNFAHDFRGSTSHVLESGAKHETLLDYQAKVLFTPLEQGSSWKLKGHLNKNTLSQEFRAYNNIDAIGVTLSGNTFVDLSILDKQVQLPFATFNPVDALNLRDSVSDPQEFGLSAYVNYDKNKDIHVIDLPFIESLPSYFEGVRRSLLSYLQVLQNTLKDIDIDQQIRILRSNINRIPQKMNDYVNRLDLDGKVKKAKERLLFLTKEYQLTAEELQEAIENYFKTLQYKIQEHISRIDRFIQENYNLDQVKEAVQMVIQKFVERLKALDEEYQIRDKIVGLIHDLQRYVERISINDLAKGLESWIQNVDNVYQIRANIRKLLQQIQAQVQRIDLDQMAANVKQSLQSIDLRQYVDEIRKALPIEKVRYIVDQIKNIVITMLNEYEVSDKISAVVDRLQDAVKEYDLDKKVQVLMDNFIQFLNQQNVKETIQKIADMVIAVDLKSYFNRIRGFVDNAVKKLTDYDFKQLIDDINIYLDLVIKKLKAFDYNTFVDDVNSRIREVTQYLNEKMKALELPQKAEVLKRHLNEFLRTATEYLREFRDIKLAEVLKRCQDIISSTVLNDIKIRLLENLEDARERIYSMDIKQECRRYLHQVSQAYWRLVTSITEQWKNAANRITRFAEENNIQDWAENLKMLIENGFVVPELKIAFINIPSFEVSLRALRQATFKTPYFTVPFTDLQVPSVEINFSSLRDMEIPMRFVTPQFTLFNTYQVPSYVIDLNEIKIKIVRTFDQILSSDFQWPSPEIYLKDMGMRDLTLNDLGFPTFSFPEIHFPNMQIPEIQIPTLALKNIQLSDIQIPEFQLPQIPYRVYIPTFGKFTSSLKVTSPFLSLTSSAVVQNTTTERNPEIVGTLSVESTSMIEALAFVLKADSRMSAPLREQLALKESVQLTNKYLRYDHSGEVTFSGNQIQSKLVTKANVRTEDSVVEFQNDINFKVQRKITASVKTKYSHQLNIPQMNVASQAEYQNDIDSSVEAGRILVTSTGSGNWKWACPSFTDDGTHQSDFKFNLRGPLMELSCSNRINGKNLKIDQSFKYDSGFLSYVNLDITSKAECPSIGNSIVSVKGKGQVSEMKLELTATHNAELTGRTTGTISNSFAFLTRPFELNFSTNNNGNLKVSFPLKLTGKIEFLNIYEVLLNTNVQQASWQVNGRFNQYKISQTISASNNEEKIGASVEMNGEANLDFLTIPVTIPEIRLPYTSIKTSKIQEFSLWERTGLKNLLTTTKQNFDLSAKLQYKKNKDMHSLSLPLEPMYDFINTNMITVNAKFGKWRESAATVLTNSYNKAKAQFDKYKVQTQANKIPRSFTIPGYTIPFVNIDVSSFSAELPAFGYVIPKEISTPSLRIPMLGFSIPTYSVVIPSFELAVLHAPDALRKISLPKFTLPQIKNSISVPALGDLTYDFSFKSNVISLTTTAGLYNQTDISARVSVVSTSVIEALQFNLDGTTGLTRKRGLKLATALALKSVFMEGKHESSMSFGRRNIEASLQSEGKINIPILKLTAKHEMTGNTKTKPTVSSKMSVNYDFSESVYGNDAKGSFDHTLSLEGLSSYLSMETVTKGDVTGTFMSYQAFNGKFINEANTYLNSNGYRSSVRIVGNAIADNFATLDVTETFGVEASTSRIYAVWEHNGKNYLRYTPAFTTTGEQSMKAKIDLAFWSLLTSLQVQISQPNSFADVASLSETINLNLYPERQEFDFTGEGILDSLMVTHNGKLSNDAANAKFEIAGSLQGHADFLKTIILPIYEKSVWDVLKFDLTTSPEKKQYLKASTSVTYTKNKDGIFFAIPVNKLTDGFVITFPAVSLKTPEWIKSLPDTVSNMEVPTELNIPSFQVPFTNLNVPSYKIDLGNIKINKKLSTIPFDLSLPSLPKVKFPKVDITTKYITFEEYKIPFFEVTIPQYQITLARYTLPKSFYGLDFNSIANKIAEIDLPTIEIPEQNIEFPPVKMNLPAGLFIPAFGSLDGSVQLSSPIYNLTWTSKLANDSGSLVASTDASSSSTLRFLEFELEASSTNSLSGRTLTHNGKASFSHPDLSIDWQQDFSFSGLRLPVHTFGIDVKSPTFTDVQIRCQHDNSRLSSSVNVPNAGTLGIVVEKDDAVIKGKLYARPSSSSGKDNLIIKGEISLKNPEKIQNKINWKEDTVVDLLNGLKVRLPRMSDAVYNCFNKYHNEHLGMDISDARLKMKEHLQSKVSSAYRSTANQIDKMEHLLQYTSDRYRDIMKNGWYQADMPMFRNLDEATANLYDNSIVILRKYKDTVKEVIDAIIEFVKMTRFQLPGQSQRYTGEELFSMSVKKVLSYLDFCYQRVQQVFDAVIQSISDSKYNIPGTEITIEGTKLISSIKTFLQELNKMTRKVFSDLQTISLEKILQQLKVFIQEVTQQSEKLVEALRSKDYQNVKVQTQQMYRDAVNSQYARDLGNLAERVTKVLNQLKIVLQSAYEDLSEKLQQLMVYGKALREEYLDPNIVGWSVKYYEIEEKIIKLVKTVIEMLRELPGKYGVDTSEAIDKIKEYLEDYYQNAGNAMAYTQEQTRQVLKELSTSLGNKITDLSFTARKVSAELHHVLLRKLQEGYEHLSRSQEKFIAETSRLVDLVVEKYNSVIEYIMQLLENFQKTTSDEVKKYVSTRKGEMKIDVPHPFTWKSFDEVPELRDEVLSKQMEIARSMVADGMDKGSKKWEELQQYIEQQLQDGKLSVQEIIENIRNWKKN